MSSGFCWVLVVAEDGGDGGAARAAIVDQSMARAFVCRLLDSQGVGSWGSQVSPLARQRAQGVSRLQRVFDVAHDLHAFGAAGGTKPLCCCC
jgi:hypothetical protein